MKRILRSLVIFAVVWFVASSATPPQPEWGFFAHRRLNRLAVFTLDPDMMPFFRSNLEYLTDHAVDPDKRRYATRHEAVRHYIDIDHWGEFPFSEVPRNWTEALLWQGEIQIIQPTADTTRWRVSEIERGRSVSRVYLVSDRGEIHELELSEYRQFWTQNLLSQYYEEEWYLTPDQLAELNWPMEEVAQASPPEDGRLLPAEVQIKVIDHFSEYGILPYHLLQHQRRLTRAFEDGRPGRILQLASEMGHYIGDATVPLHTTENYNGQLTNQIGIHGFWESRIPELIADERFDFLVGKSDYIADPAQYYWEIVLDSHALVDSVLNTEKRLSETYPQDRQFCFEERLDRSIRTQCSEYALAWNEAMDGMVEERFRTAILAIGSAWYTAWVDAGQPDLRGMGFREELVAIDSLDQAFRRGEIRGRQHDN